MATVDIATAVAPDVKFLFPSGVQQGQTRTITVHGKSGTAPLRVWTNDERLTGTLNDKGDQLELSATADLPPALYWLRIVNDEGASELQPIVVGLLPELTESDLQTESEKQSPQLPTTINGVLSKGGEVDSYSVSLDAGQTLIASVDSHRLFASPADVVLQLVTEAGFVIAQNDDHHGFDPQIVHRVTETGSYGMRVFAFPATPNSTIRFAGGESYTYRLTLTTGPFVDHLFPLGIDLANPSGLVAHGWNLPADIEPLTATTAAPLMIESRHPGSVLVNRIRPLAIPLIRTADDQNAETPAMLPMPGAVCGHISTSGEIDSYRIEGKSGQNIEVTIAAQAFDSPLDPVLRFTNGEGKLIKETDDIAKENADIRLEVKIPDAGEYRLHVTDRFGHGGMRYAYMMTLHERQPQYRLSTEKTHYELSTEKSVEIPVNVDRIGGFDSVITVSIAGLPEGVSCTSVESSAKGDTSKRVKLKVVTDGRAAFADAVSVVGESEGGDSIRAMVTSPVAGLTIEGIWLTAITTKPAEKSPEPTP